MKVLHVLGELRHSGAERMLACSYRQWCAAGVEPVIVGMGDGDHPFAPALIKAGYEVTTLPGVRSLRGLAALSRLIQTARPQIVHIHSETCFDAVALVAALASNVEGIARTVHSNFRFRGFLRARRSWRVGLARQLGVIWVACSAEVAETERCYYADDVLIVENWVDVDEINHSVMPQVGHEVRNELGIEDDAKVLALIGNCGGAKNHELIPTALRGLERPVHVLHVGDTHFQSQSEASAWLDVPGQHTVHHLGARDDVPRLLTASDLLVVPSLYEGMPLVPAEAICVGVPVLGANTVGLQWLAPIESATLIELDPRAWTIAIADALVPKSSSAAVTATATLARARFGSERGVGEYVDAYEASLRVQRPFGRRRPQQAMSATRADA